MSKYVIALDQGTTSSRAIVFNKASEIIAMSQAEFPQIYPKPGWVEQNPMAIYSSQYSVLSEVLAESAISPKDIVSIGITNQRETTIVWEKSTGKPIYNAIVWQCRRTSQYAEELAADAAFSEYVEKTTGLRIDAYFSATKIRWILDNVEGALEKAQSGELLFGTVDTWLLWKFTNGLVHATDYTNASRTMLFNIETLQWDENILEKLGIPIEMLPKVKPSSYPFGEVNISGHLLPISGIAGDQQAALYGQACFHEGQMKNTYGTGCFLLMHTGNCRHTSKHGLITTLAASTSIEPQYAIEGSVFVGGATIQWLRDEMRFFEETADSSYFATKVKDNGGVYFVPAFTGLAAPHWDMNARGMMIGITRGTTRNHIIRAGLESIAFQVNDLILAIQKDTGIQLSSLRVDGGASNNPFLMQFQADISNIDILRPEMLESTALGAAYLAGLNQGYWKNEEEIIENSKIDAVFSPTMDKNMRENEVNKWNKAVGRSLNWID